MHAEREREREKERERERERVCVCVGWVGGWVRVGGYGCQIQEAARPPYEAEIVPANKRENEEGEFRSPEQNTQTTAGGHP